MVVLHLIVSAKMGIFLDILEYQLKNVKLKKKIVYSKRLQEQCFYLCSRVFCYILAKKGVGLVPDEFSIA